MLEKEIIKKLKQLPQHQVPEEIWSKIERTINAKKTNNPLLLSDIFSFNFLQILKPAFVLGITACLIYFTGMEYHKFQTHTYLNNSLAILYNPNSFYSKTFVASIDYYNNDWR